METISLYEYPERDVWQSLMTRAVAETRELHDTVAAIIADVRSRGDVALREMAARFDGVQLGSLKVTADEIAEAVDAVPHELKNAIAVAAKNISKFHKAQRMEEIVVETVPGVTCRQKAVPITRVGLYIPGGNSPLFSTVLMLAIPARLAGCRKIVLCTPPGKDGKVHPAILYAASIAGVTEIYKVGGAQAIAAMAFGTESVPRVSKIFGPGNRFVMEAKQQVSLGAAAIDMPAGPSEVMIIADGNADARFVASDFLSQAEHGPDSQSILLTSDATFATKLPAVIEELLATLPRQEMMRRSLAHSRVILLHNDDEIMAFANDYAPEHLIINHADAEAIASRVENAGSVFIGGYSPESAGDYASGTNHTLPTMGAARYTGGVWVGTFLKTCTNQRMSPEGTAKIAPLVSELARGEGLMGHAKAADIRISD